VSFAVDVNILLYASDRSSPHSTKAMEFLERCASDTEVCCFAWPTLMGYLRMSTHPAIFRTPLSPSESMRNVEALLGLPHVRVLSEEEGFWAVYRQVTQGMAVRGNLVPDAHLAAILRQHDVRTLHTNDLDFKRFDFLDVRNPLAFS
jgi:uncharacterized protein